MTINSKHLNVYRLSLIDDESAPSTIQRYLNIVEKFAAWLGGRKLTKELLLEWRGQLDLSIGSINVCVSAVNRLLELLGYSRMRLKHLKIQNTVFRPSK